MPASPMSTVEEIIRNRVAEGLATAVEEIRQDVIKTAVKDFETRIRERVGKTAINLASFYSVQRMGQEIIINVRIPQEKA